MVRRRQKLKIGAGSMTRRAMGLNGAVPRFEKGGRLVGRS